MVESIFGGKATYHLGGCEKSISHPRGTERRLSVQSQLRTIAESGDDNVPSERASVVQEFETGVSNAAGSSYHRRPRTRSLPAIYRDGSYLIIRRPSNVPISCQRRRFSEPAGLKTQQTIRRLSPVRLSDNSTVSEESENASCKRSFVKNEEVATGASKKSSGGRDLLAPRRHSDPMCLVTEQVEKPQGLSQDRQERSSNNYYTVGPQMTGLSVCGKNKPQMQTDSEQTGEQVPTRRRKTSLVPVPFKAPVLDVKKARHCQQKASIRPISFPPSTKERQQFCLLPALTLKTGFVSKYFSSESKESEIERDLNNNFELVVNEQSLQSDNSAYLQDKLSTDEAILVQWMKFFG